MCHYKQHLNLGNKLQGFFQGKFKKNNQQGNEMLVKNITRKKMLVSQAYVCDSVLTRTKGLMFHQKIRDLAFILAFPKEQHVALHMYFVFFPIDVLFLDKNKKVVEMKKQFMPFTQYIAARNAKYIVEMPDGTINASRTKVGDRIKFLEAADK
jgi:uncharacterized protein